MEILVPISLGELYDKISILELKLQFINDEEKRINLTNELKKLQEISIKYPIDEKLFDRLKNINLEIWYTEDKIRLKEKNQDFRFDFIIYARRIYQRNDKRSKIKREINLKYGSDIIEEKSYEKYD